MHLIVDLSFVLPSSFCDQVKKMIKLLTVRARDTHKPSLIIKSTMFLFNQLALYCAMSNILLLYCG